MKTDRLLTPASVVRQCSDQVNCNLDEEVVVLNLKNGNYYNFDPIAANIWQSLNEPISVDTLVKRQCVQYDISTQQCRQDITSFLDVLLDVGLIEINEQ